MSMMPVHPTRRVENVTAQLDLLSGEPVEEKEPTLLQVLTAAFKDDRWVQPDKAARLALRTLGEAGYVITKSS